jgi:hypothetical protein
MTTSGGGMTVVPQNVAETIARFDEVNFHDCYLLGLEIKEGENGATPDVILDLIVVWGGRDGEKTSAAKLSFVDCICIKSEFDFFFKWQFADRIIYAEALYDTAWLETVREYSANRARKQRLDDLTAFRIGLTPPSNRLEVLARDFHLSPPKPGAPDRPRTAGGC